MAIQFNCPYCTVTIQVPDNAAGKKGTCPQCGTKVLVPVPKNAPAQPAVPSPPPTFTPPPAVPNFAPPSAPMFPPPPTMPQAAPPMAGYPPAGIPYGFDPNQPMAMPPGYPAPAGFAPPQQFGQAPQSLPTEPPSTATTFAKRRPKKNQPLLFGVIAVVVIAAGVAAFVFLKPGAKPNPLSGTLTGTRLTKGKLQPAIVHRDWLEGIDEETVTAVLKQMEKRKVTLRSDTVVLVFQGVTEGIKVTATPGLHAELVAVDVSSHKALNSWQQKQGAKLSDRHQKEVIRAAKSFVQEWAKAEAAGEKKFDFSRFHDDLGLGALTSGLGSEAIAIVNRTPHSCVAEQQGLLYFLLPPSTERFELQGREDEKGVATFPGHFVVEVEAEAPTKKPTKTDDEPEMADEDDAEMKSKSFGKPALNDPSAIDESMPEKGKKKGTKNEE